MPSLLHAAPTAHESAMPAPRAIPPGSSRDALTAALRTLDAAEVLAEPATLALSLAQVGRCYRALSDADSAAWYLERGLRWARVLGAPDACIEILCELAEAAAARADALEVASPRAAHTVREQARDQSFEATRLAGRSADPQWEIKVLLRIADVLDRCGDHDDAVALQCRAMRLISEGTMAEAPQAPPQAPGSAALN